MCCDVAIFDKVFSVSILSLPYEGYYKLTAYAGRVAGVFVGLRRPRKRFFSSQHTTYTTPTHSHSFFAQGTCVCIEAETE